VQFIAMLSHVSNGVFLNRNASNSDYQRFFDIYAS